MGRYSQALSPCFHRWQASSLLLKTESRVSPAPVGAGPWGSRSRDEAPAALEQVGAPVGRRGSPRSIGAQPLTNPFRCSPCCPWLELAQPGQTPASFGSIRRGRWALQDAESARPGGVLDAPFPDPREIPLATSQTYPEFDCFSPLVTTWLPPSLGSELSTGSHLP